MSETVTNSQEYSTNSPGAILKRCREYHGISLEEAAEATKVGVAYLTALEEDRINEFASLAYLKGFLRIYASHLGLNADDMMRLYEKLYTPARADKGAPAEEAGDAGTARRRRFSWRKLSLPAILLLLLIMTSWVIRRQPAPPPQPPAAPATGTTAALPVQPQRTSLPSVVSPPKDTQAPKPGDAQKIEEPLPVPGVPKAPADSPKGFVARMKVIQNGTLAVTIDGAMAQNYDLVPGDVIEWKAEKNIILELSNAGGVEVELNGKPLKPFGPEGKPVYITLGAEGVKS